MGGRIRAVSDISIENLCERGIKGVLLDLDNTIIAWGEEVISHDMRNWLQQGKGYGIRFCLLSNSYTHRAKRIAHDLQIPVVAPALKPFPFGYLRAMTMIGTDSENTVIIGDQLFTDILGARLLRIDTIGVIPISNTDFWATRFARCLERLVWK